VTVPATDGVTTGDLASEAVDMSQVLPAETLRSLTESFTSVLTLAAARGADMERQACWLAAFVAPWLAEHGVEQAHVQRAADLAATRLQLDQARAELADARLQLEQAGAALAQAVAEATRLGDLGHARHEVAERLRGELAAAGIAAGEPSGRHARPDGAPLPRAGDAETGRGSRTLTVMWAPAAVEGAVERALALTVGHGDPDGMVGPIAWMDLACLVDAARAVLRGEAS
jgi:multidrug efflux pump subunit AcrA (membrane-fusion protein)